MTLHGSRVLRPLGIAASLTALCSAGVGPARADSPPDSWANERLLTCDGRLVHTYLTPAGFGTPFHVVGSDDVIIPKHVVVVFSPGSEPVVTVSVPGFDRTRDGATHCTYTDPVGLAVDFWGLRS